MGSLRNNNFVRIVLAAVIISVIFFWLRDVFSGEEGRIRKFILQGKKAAEAKDIVACAEMISHDYRDKYGNDRQGLIYIGRRVLDYYKAIMIGIEKSDIKLDKPGKQADVEITAMVLCQSPDNRTDKIFEGDRGRFRVRLLKQGGKWKLAEIEFLERLTIMGQDIL